MGTSNNNSKKRISKALNSSSFKETKTYEITRKEMSKGGLKQVYSELR